MTDEIEEEEGEDLKKKGVYRVCLYVCVCERVRVYVCARVNGEERIL